MSIILDLLKEIPLTAVLRERISEIETKIAVLETKNSLLEKENSELRSRLKEIEAEKDAQGDLCPYCRKPKGQLLRLEPDPMFGELGVKVGYYKCDQCSREYDRQQKP